MTTLRDPHPDKSASKQSKIKPARTPSSNIFPFVSQARCYVWAYAREWNAKKQTHKWIKPTLSPKLGVRYAKTFRWGKDRWGKDYWDQNKDLFGTFEEAFAAYRNERLQGIGFIVESERRYEIGGQWVYVVVIEADDCYDPETGRITVRWFEELVKRFDTYVELSPSGTGLHIIATGERLPNSCSNLQGKFPGGIDAHLYGGGVGGRHPVTFTGVPLEGYDLPPANIQGWLDDGAPVKERAVRDEPRGARGDVSGETLEEAREGAIHRIAKKDGLSVEEVCDKVQKARAATNGEILETLRRVHGREFGLLWDGEYQEARLKDRSHSGADQKLALMLSSGTGLDAERMDELFRLSGLYRPDKWDRQSYREPTIRSAFDLCDRIYEPFGQRSVGQGKPASSPVPKTEMGAADRGHLEMLENSKGERFRRLWEGDASLFEGESSPYRSYDAAVLGLCAMLAFATGNDEEGIDGLFRQSGLYAEKWEDEKYRKSTITKALSETTYAPSAEGEWTRRLNANLKILEEGALGLRWKVKHGLHARYVYRALIKQRYDINKNGDVPHHHRDGLAVATSQRGLMLGSGIYSKAAVEGGLRVLEEEGLIKIFLKGQNGEPSIIILPYPKNVPKDIIPYPPGWIGTERDARKVLDAYEFSRIDWWEWAHAEENFDPTAVRKPKLKYKKPFRSPLNSLATREIQHLVTKQRLDGGPDAGKHHMYWWKGEPKSHYEPHPLLAFTSPFNEPFAHIPHPDQDRPMSHEAERKLVRLTSLNLTQKFVVEQVNHGRYQTEELEKFLSMRRDNLRTNVLNPLVRKGLVESFDLDTYFGRREGYRLTENFEEALEEEYERSGSQERYERVLDQVDRERHKHREDRQRWAENERKAKERGEESRELIEWYEELMAKKKART